MKHEQKQDTFEGMLEKRNEKLSPMRRIMGYFVQFGVPLVLTVLMVWYIFKKVDFSQMVHILQDGVNYWLIIMTMFITIFAHVFRAMRWRLQLKALGINPPFMAVCCSIFGTYALNLLFPRLGEVWRCTYIARMEKASFTKVLGSMIADRLSDTILVFCLTAFTFLVASYGMVAFLTKYPVGQDVLKVMGNVWFWVAIVGGVIALWACYIVFRETKIMTKIRETVIKFWGGFAVVAKMKGRGKFIVLSLCIWGCYFMHMYISFYAFPFTRNLCFEDGTFFGLLPCLVAFVVSSISMAVPSNGGLGPWNIAVMFGLAVYGIGEAQGATFSMVVWSSENLMLILLGIYTMVYISVTRSHKRDKVANKD